MAGLSQRANDLGSLPHDQTGFSLWSGLYALITLGAIVLIAVQTVPVYLNNRDIQNALDEVARTPSLQDADPIRIKRALGQHFEAGYASGVSAHDMTISRHGDTRRLELRYEVRRPLVLNASMLYSFDDVARMPGGRG